LKQAVETGEVDDFDIGRAVSAKRIATTVPLARKKAVLELVDAGNHEPILDKTGALTVARSAVRSLLQYLLLSLDKNGDGAADALGGGGDEDSVSAAASQCRLGLVLPPCRTANRSMVWTLIMLFIPFVLTDTYHNACHLFPSSVIRLPLSLLAKYVKIASG
jgi:hypothetical protein